MIAGLGIALLAAPRMAVGQPTKAASPTATATSAVIPSAKPAPQLMDAAQRHHEDGVRFFEAGNYEAARVEFEAGYKLDGKPAWLFNLAKTCQRQGNLEDARRYAKSYEAAVGVGDKEAVELLASIPTAAAPAPAAAPAANITPSSPPRVSPAAWVLLGLGGACLVSAIGTSAAASNLSKQVDAGPLALPDFQAAQSLGEGLNRASISLLSVGLALGVAGGTWAIVNRFYGRQHKTP